MVSFEVTGMPRPKGSFRAFNDKAGKAHAAPASSKEKGWALRVRHAARAAMDGTAPFTGPVTLSLTFYIPRPKKHFGTGKNATVLKAKAPKWPITPADASKLTRSVEDALNGVVFADDAQVVSLFVQKRYTSAERPEPGVRVCAWPWNSEERAPLSQEGA